MSPFESLTAHQLPPHAGGNSVLADERGVPMYTGMNVHRGPAAGRDAAGAGPDVRRGRSLPAARPRHTAAEWPAEVSLLALGRLRRRGGLDGRSSRIRSRLPGTDGGVVLGRLLPQVA